mgnify:CR=1 FL=1
MTILKAKPTSPGRRGVISIKSDLTRGDPLNLWLNQKIKKVEEIIMEELQ